MRIITEDLDFVYDRNKADIDRVLELTEKYMDGTITQEEIAEWNAGLKGALNLSDLERNEYNLYYLAYILQISITTKYNPSTHQYSIPDIPRPDYYTDLRQNARTIRNTASSLGYIHSDTPTVPASPLNTFDKWNDIEKLLFDIYEMIKINQEDYLYCGEFYGGESIGIL